MEYAEDIDWKSLYMKIKTLFMTKNFKCSAHANLDMYHVIKNLIEDDIIHILTL